MLTARGKEAFFQLVIKAYYGHVLLRVTRLNWLQANCLPVCLLVIDSVRFLSFSGNPL